MLHEKTFEFHRATDEQIAAMQSVRNRFSDLAEFLDVKLPAGADKKFVMRELRTAAMWANVALTRHTDGEPRE